MNHYKRIFAVMWLLLLVNAGCKKYLDIKSDSSLIVPSTLDDLQGLLDDAGIMNYNTAAFGAASADDYFLEDNSFQAKNIFQQHVYLREPFEYRYINDWSLAYSAVYNANTCLERIASITPAAAEVSRWNNVKGSALFYRAWYFLELSGLFSKAYDAATAAVDAGIVLRLGTDFNRASVRAPVKTCYEQIVADAKEAAGLLPNLPDNTTRPSKCAAYGLLARTYLNMRLYDSAGHYARQALQLKGSLINYNDAAEVDMGNYYRFKRVNSETIFYSTMNFYLSLYHPLFGSARIDTLLYASYNDNDLRKTVLFSEAGSYRQFAGNYAADYGLFSGIATDELILTAAECAARAGNLDEGLLLLNRLLENRFATGSFVPVVAGTPEQLLQVILLERRKELLCRGSLRWMDIKRLNKEDAGIELTRVVAGERFTLPPNDKRYALQLPADVIEQSGMEQN